MAEHVPVPVLAETTDLYVVDGWLVAVGQRVAAGDPVATMETDKVTVEVTCPLGGTIVALGGEVGDELRTGDPLLTIEAE